MSETTEECSISKTGGLLDSASEKLNGMISYTNSPTDLHDGEDEGIEILEISDSFQMTPDASSSNSLLCDSGFAESLEDLKLRCFECVLEWPTKPESVESEEGGPCMCNMQEHMGFEEYVEDIFMYRLSMEDQYHVPDCLLNQPEISPAVRGALIQWLTSVHHSLKLCQDTLYLTVNMLDRVFNEIQVSRDCLELLGITCLLVSCKQNEVTLPEIKELLPKCSEQFSRHQVLQLEMIVLLATSFNLMPPTVQQFLEYFASFCITASQGDSELIYRLKMARAVGRCVLELSLQEYTFNKFKPSLLALCVWKASVEYLKTHDGHFYPPGMTFTHKDYDLCLAEVHLFISNIQKSNTKASEFCKRYTSLNVSL